MSLNFFDVLSGADKEMMHSAMIRYVLQEHEVLGKTLFSKFPYKIGPVDLEKSYSIDKKTNDSVAGQATSNARKRYRIDIEAQSEDGKELLVIENKFKAFPTYSQLQDYDSLYSTKKEQGELCFYLVCFDSECIAFPDSDVVRTKRFIWNLLTYKTIAQRISDYLDTNVAIDVADSLFLRHYEKYLTGYYNDYNAVCEQYSKAFFEPKDKDVSGLKNTDNRFWQRLILTAICNKFVRKFEGAKDNRPASGVICDTSYAGSTDPLVTIYPMHWNRGSKEYKGQLSPALGIQIQKERVKLCFIDARVDQKNTKWVEQVLLYREAILRPLPDSVEVVEVQRVKALLEGKKRLVTLCWQPLNIETDIQGLVEQIWSFYKLMNEYIEPHGSVLAMIN